MAALEQTEIVDRLKSLPDWSVRDSKLHREYRFGSFVKAFSFMAGAALEIEKLNHHPEWFNVYGTVRVDLTTHDCGGISAKDFELAHILDGLARPWL